MVGAGAQPRLVWSITRELVLEEEAVPVPVPRPAHQSFTRRLSVASLTLALLSLQQLKKLARVRLRPDLRLRLSQVRPAQLGSPTLE